MERFNGEHYGLVEWNNAILPESTSSQEPENAQSPTTAPTFCRGSGVRFVGQHVSQQGFSTAHKKFILGLEHQNQ
jgi:hypothetical protein